MTLHAKMTMPDLQQYPLAYSPFNERKGGYLLPGSPRILFLSTSRRSNTLLNPGLSLLLITGSNIWFIDFPRIKILFSTEHTRLPVGFLDIILLNIWFIFSRIKILFSTEHTRLPAGFLDIILLNIWFMFSRIKMFFSTEYTRLPVGFLDIILLNIWFMFPRNKILFRTEHTRLPAGFLKNTVEPKKNSGKGRRQLSNLINLVKSQII